MLPAEEQKRKAMEDDGAVAAGPSTKRHKVDTTDTSDQGDNVGATELASAFALASLAGHNSITKAESGTAKGATTANNPKILATVSESKETDSLDGGSMVSWEARSPRNEIAPVTPEVRSPMARRVTFASGIKEVSRLGPRMYSFPPRVSHLHQASRMPPGFARGPQTPNQIGMPQVARHHHMQGGPWMARRGHPPIVPHGAQQGFVRYSSVPAATSDKWFCDFCNVAAFPSFREACAHEENCQARVAYESRRFAGPWGGHSGAQPPGMPISPVSPYAGRAMGPAIMNYHYSNVYTAHKIQPRHEYVDKAPTKFYEGSLSLAVPDSDSDWLSPLNCFIREQCVEAFTTSEDESNKYAKRGRITEQQVGIRCRFCKVCPIEDRQPAAVSYPLSVSGIYESVKRWQRVHVENCQDIPENVKSRLQDLETENSWIPTTRQYWADSANALGIIDTPDGIRFSFDPSTMTKQCLPHVKISASSSHEDLSLGNDDSAGNEKNEGGSKAEGEYIVYPEDTQMVPPYVYFLMRQVESCSFTEADRFVARSKGPVGYPGFQCRHCNGHAGLGKYFPVTAKSLATNSTSQNIHAHLLKCRKCPAHIKDQLASMKEEKSKAPRLEPGWRKIFFDKIWSRLHG